MITTIQDREFACRSPRTAVRGRAGGFTLVELLLAVFLLTIGLIGLLSIFPIGADWTRQITEESISQTVARDAMAMIEGKYSYSDLSGVNSYSLVAMPNLATKFPASERSYQYGASQPFPTLNSGLGATYFWTAVVRLSPDQPTDGTGHVYDIYVLVMKKGQMGDTYTSGSISSPPTVTMSELSGGRAGSGENHIPAVVTDTYFRAAKSGNSFLDANTRNTPQIGDLGIGKNSGTVFRQYSDGTRIYMTQPIIGTFAAGGVSSTSDSGVEPILWVPPADPMNRPHDDATPSPLVYVFQKKIAY